MTIGKSKSTQAGTKRKPNPVEPRPRKVAKHIPSRKAKRARGQDAAKQLSAPGTGATARSERSKERSSEPSIAEPARGSSKLDTVLAMLQAPGGTTIAAIMTATGWQQHSVRGFFTAVVRKKLKLELTSDKVDGERRYRIGKPTEPK
jgi:hypothetical protein